MTEETKYTYTDEDDENISEDDSFLFKSLNDSIINETLLEDSLLAEEVSSGNEKHLNNSISNSHKHSEAFEKVQSSVSKSSTSINLLKSNEDLIKTFNSPNVSGVMRIQKSIIDTDSEDEESRKTASSSKARITQKPIVDSDSDDNSPINQRKLKQLVQSDSEDEESRKSLSSSKARITQKPIIDSDSEDDNFIKRGKLRPLVQSDSEDDGSIQEKPQDIFQFTRENEVVKSTFDGDLSSFSSADEQQLSSDEDQNKKEDIVNNSTNVRNSKISQDFRFGSNGLDRIRPDAVAEKGTHVVTSKIKRSLNRSVDTPRIIKQLKESKTPLEARTVFSPSFQSTMVENDFSNGSESDGNESDVIEVSSEGEVNCVEPTRPQANKINRQTTIDTHFSSSNTELPSNKSELKQDVIVPLTIEVSRQTYQQQQEKVYKFQADIQKALNVLRTVNLDLLPDKGLSIELKHKALENSLMEEVKKLSQMTIKKENVSVEKANYAKDSKIKVLTWDQIEAKAAAVQPKTFGKQAMSTHNAQRAVTMERLHQLHGSLKTCPKETDSAEDPKGLKVDLMPHQKYALAWMLWREGQQPSGGILADDMGLGKTLTVISLLLKSKETECEDSDDSDNENKPTRLIKPNGGTLVVCPASLIDQWATELERRTKRGLASYEMYHGPKRETKPKRLAEHDMVITTYAIINNECERNGPVFRVRWRRIILDEAHQVRNFKCQTSVAVCKLSAKSRWALTGTPVHNKELDMFALLKFLRCSPFDDLSVWKRWVSDKTTGGQERLHTVISSLMLRRTKEELIQKGKMTVLPERKWELISVQLNKNEFDVYNKILIFSRTLFAAFLHQRAEKNQDSINLKYAGMEKQNDAPNQEYFMMRQKLLRLNKVKDIKQHEILVLLLRLRQICCHPSLITGMLHEDMGNLGGDDEDNLGHQEELDLLEQLNRLALDEDQFSNSTPNPEENLSQKGAALKDATKGWLNPNHPIFSKKKASSKILALLEVMKKKILPTSDKAIIVSQWPSFLELIASQLKLNDIPYDQLDGKVPVNKRAAMVNSFNDPNNKLKVLLLSLTAGGVGLNLVGGNHLFLLDLHWNPQLENQAQDRIYRVGQQKPVFVYKFLATDTIEKRILDLQEKKLNVAKAMLTGTKQAIVNKLSLQDLKLLFDM